MYVYIHIYAYIYTWTRALTRLDTGRKVALKECAEKCADLEQNLNLKEVRHQPSPMISYGDCQVRITRPFGCPLLTCESSCDASNAWPLGPAAFFREVRKKRTMTYGPIWSQKWWKWSRIHIYKRVMVPWLVKIVPTSIWMSISIHRFIDPVDRSRSISTVDKDSPTGEYGRYWWSIRIYLQRIFADRRCALRIPHQNPWCGIPHRGFNPRCGEASHTKDFHTKVARCGIAPHSGRGIEFVGDYG